MTLANLAEGGHESRQKFRTQIDRLDMHRWKGELCEVYQTWDRLHDKIPYFLVLNNRVRKHIDQALRRIKETAVEEHQVLPDLIFRKKQTLELVETYRHKGTLPTWFGSWRNEMVGEELKELLAFYVQPLKNL